MIHASLCLSGRDLSEPVPSPDGASVLFGVRSGGRSALALVPASGGPERVLAIDPAPALGRGLGGGCADWLIDSSGFVYASADGQMWLHRLDGDRRALTCPAPGREVSSPCVSPDGRSVAYVVDLAEVHVVRLDDPSSDRVLAGLSDSVSAFVIDPAWSPDGSTLVWQAWNVPDMPWDESFVAGVDVAGIAVPDTRDRCQVQQPRFSSDGALWTVDDSSGWLNVQRNGVPVVAEPYEHAGPTWGPGQRSYAVSPDGRRVVFNRNERGFGRLVLVNLDTGTTTEVAKGVHGQLRWTGDRVTALRTGGRTPSQIVAYDLSSATGPWERTTLAVGPVAEWSQLDRYLVEPELMEARSANGTTVPMRVYRPTDDSAGAPAGAPSRLIVWVHGGPTDQWQVTFMPRITFWVSRGWTVLVPDHRGSTGHGRAFQQALRGRWGDADMDDVAASIRHAHALGLGSPESTVLMGGSAGGYVVLNVLVEHPDLAAGAAVVYPVTDPQALADTTYRFEAHYADTLVGPAPVIADPTRLTRPVLILHGDADAVVPVAQSERFTHRAEQVGAHVELHVFAGEGHGFRQPANQLAEYVLTEAFVKRIVPHDTHGEGPLVDPEG